MRRVAEGEGETVIVEGRGERQNERREKRVGRGREQNENKKENRERSEGQSEKRGRDCERRDR